MFEKVKPYPQDLQKLLTFNGFLALFYSRLNDFKTDQEVYESVEETHERYFGKRKYSSYQTFKVMRAKNIKR